MPNPAEPEAPFAAEGAQAATTPPLVAPAWSSQPSPGAAPAHPSSPRASASARPPEEGGARVGHASLTPMGLGRIAHVVRLDLCVHLGHWRRGHGRALLTHLLAWADRTAAVHKVELLVRSSNAPAVALYGRAGFRIEHSEASLYLWATRGEDCWDTVSALADQGILVAPGAFYGRAGRRHVRVAFTATDERIEAAASRLAG